jgi:broad specificity phosphatase PhoE
MYEIMSLAFPYWLLGSGQAPGGSPVVVVTHGLAIKCFLRYTQAQYEGNIQATFRQHSVSILRRF